MDKKICIYIKDRKELKDVLVKLKSDGWVWADNSKIFPTKDSMDPEIYTTYNDPRSDLGNVLVLLDDNSVSIANELVVTRNDVVYDGDEYIAL